MHPTSKKLPYGILAITSLVFSKVSFLFLNDPEGPNLLIVTVTAGVIYVLSLTSYLIGEAGTSQKKFLLALCIQVLVVVGLYFFFT